VKAGDKYAPETIDSSIKALIESGYVDDATYLVKPNGNEVILIAKVEERHPMGPSGFIGNLAFSDQKLAKEIDLDSSELITAELMETGRQRLKSFYVSHGYTDVEVSFRPYREGKPNLRDFIFVIEEGAQQPQN
jgi:outer membrane protein assembly factor BamA